VMVAELIRIAWQLLAMYVLNGRFTYLRACEADECWHNRNRSSLIPFNALIDI
jgi:hypothetical protein